MSEPFGGIIEFVEQELVLLSPEKTILTYRLAGLGARVFAHVIDVLIILVAEYVAVVTAGILSVTSIAFLAIPLWAIFAVSFIFLYFILLESFWNGQTIGKKAVGIRARMADGTAITSLAAIGRNLLRVADFLPGMYFVGLLAMFTTPRSQRLGDLVANTVVTYERRALPVFTPAPHSAGIHPLEYMVGELRGMTLDEYNALRRYCDRFPELASTAQVRLTADVWLPIAEKRKVPMAPNIHPIYLAEAVVMKYGREHGLL